MTSDESVPPNLTAGVSPSQTRTLNMPRDSLRTVFLEMIFSPDGPNAQINDKYAVIRGTGTGFLYRDQEKTFVITARHNLTGRNWETNEFINQDYPVEPTHLRFTLRERHPYSPDVVFVSGGSNRLRMYAAALIDEEYQPTWLEHPTRRAEMDVAAIPVPDTDEAQMLPWSESDIGEDDHSKLLLTQPLSIIGYPYGLSSGPALPLWIQGSIASEPVLYYTHNGRNLPAFLIDARTRKGQSGSPVVLLHRPSTTLATISGGMRVTTGFYSRLLGVYTGRVSADSDLGFVWHIEDAVNVCRGVRPNYPFEPLPRIPPDTPNFFGSLRDEGESADY